MKKFEFRPWGWFLTLDEGSDYKVKKIYVKPKSRFSLQYHHKRDEYWTIIQGSGIITYEKDGDEINQDVSSGDNFVIDMGTLHRMKGGDDGITFIEVQRGVCDESDIVRISDDYKRC